MNSAPGTMPSILLVEDDRISAAFLSAALATLPARVHVAEDRAQALAASGPSSRSTAARICAAVSSLPAS